MDHKEQSEKNVLEKFEPVSEETNQATTSRLSVDPEQNSHNMNDLKTLDFNSADEIRQTMKAVLSGKVPHHAIEEDNSHGNVISEVDVKTNDDKKPVKIEKTAENEQTIAAIKTEPKENVFQFINPRTDRWSSKECNIRKRPGRPPKAGTSKKVKKASVTALYIGKLSNVVPFKRRRVYRSESESDDSLIIFY